jgi:hypothetical protein
VDGGVIRHREQAKCHEQKKNHRSTTTGEEAIRRPAGQISSGHAAEWKDGVFECRKAHAVPRHLLQLRDAPVGESVAAGIQQQQRHGNQPESGIGERELDVGPETASGRFRSGLLFEGGKIVEFIARWRFREEQ